MKSSSSVASRLPRTRLAWTTLLALGLLCAGCGQKGALRLPGPAVDNPGSALPAAPAPPASAPHAP